MNWFMYMWKINKKICDDICNRLCFHEYLSESFAHLHYLIEHNLNSNIPNYVLWRLHSLRQSLDYQGLLDYSNNYIRAKIFVTRSWKVDSLTFCRILALRVRFTSEFSETFLDQITVHLWTFYVGCEDLN